MARLKIYDKIYDSSAVDEPTVLEIWKLNEELKSAGLPFDYADFEQLTGEFATLKKDEVEAHPQKLQFIAFTIWLARRSEGLGFLDAIDVPPSKIVFLQEPSDRRGPTKKAAKKAVKKAPAKRSGSGSAQARSPRKPAAKTSSISASTSGSASSG